MGIHDMPASVSLLGSRNTERKFDVLMYGVCLLSRSLAIWLLCSSFNSLFAATTYTVNAYFTDPALYADFLANATNQYNGTLKAGLFSNTQNFTASSKKTVIVPPPPAQPISDGTAFQQCFAYGWAFGSDWERTDDLRLIQMVKSSANLTCGPDFDVLASTISEKNGTVLVVPAHP